MAVTTQVQVIVSAKDTASAVLGGLKNQLGTLQKSANNLGEDLQTVGKIAIGGVAAFVAFGVKAGMTAARVDELSFALNAIGKANDVSQKSIDKTVESLRSMNIAHDKALQTTTLFIQGQLKLTDAVKLATAAKDLAVVAGLDSSEATQTLTSAILKQSPMLLRQFGIVKGLAEIYDDYGKTINKAGSELSQLDKRQAFLNSILLEGKKVAGVYDASMDSVSKRFRSLTGRIIPDFMAQIGQAFSPALTIIIDAISNAIKQLSTWITNNQDTIIKWGEQLGAVVAIIISGIGAFIGFLMNNKEIFIGIFAAMAVGIGALVVAFVSAHGVVMAVLAAITLVVTLLAKAWNENFLGIQTIIMFFVDTFKLAFETIQTIVTNVMKWFNETALPSITGFFEGIKNVLLFFAAIWQLLWAVVQDVVTILFNWFWSWAGPTIEAFFSWVVDKLKIFVNFWKEYFEVIEQIATFLVDFFNAHIAPTLKAVFEMIIGDIKHLKNQFEEKFNWIKDKVNSVINFIKNLINNFRPKIHIGIELPNIEEAWSNLKQRARNIGVPGFQTGGIVPGPIGAQYLF